MPTIPYDPVRKATVQGEVATSSAHPEDLLGGLQRGLGALGESVSNYANAFMGLQREAEATDAHTKLGNKLRDLAWNQKTGYYTTQEKGAVDGYEPYTAAVDQAYTEARSTLKDPIAQRMFDRAARSSVNEAKDSGAQHAAKQNVAWQDNSSKASVELSMNNIGDYYNDPTRFNTELGTIYAEIQKTGERHGMSQDAISVMQHAHGSLAWENRIEHMAVKDPLGAQALYQTQLEEAKKNGVASPIEPKEQVTLEKTLKSATDPIMSRNLAKQIMSGRKPDNADSFTSWIKKRESGGRRYADSGEILTSPTGAKGEMQVLDSTNLDPGFGVTPAKDDSPDERARVGKDYSIAMLKRYGGNGTLAAAAYNGGPGRVDKWIQEFGDPRDGKISNEDWAAKIPRAETRDYAQAYMKDNPSTPGEVQTSEDPRQHLGEWEKQAREAAQAYAPNDPLFADMVVGEVTSHTGQIVAAQQGVQRKANDTIANFASGLSAEGKPGGAKPKTMEEFQALPGAPEAWRDADDDTRRAVVSKLDANAKEKSSGFTDEGFRKWDELHGMAFGSPEAQDAFLAEDLNKYLHIIPDEKLAELRGVKDRLLAADIKTVNKQHKLANALKSVTPIVLSAGLDTTPKEGTKKAENWNIFVGRFNQQIEQYEAQNKKYPDEDHLRKIANALVAEGSERRNWMWDKGGVHAYQEQDMSKFYIEVPGNKKDGMIADYKKVYGKAPTDQQLQDFYTKFRLAGNE